MYNFVIFASDFHCYETSYSDIIGLENVRYISNYLPKKNKILKYLFLIHHSKRINKYIRIPYKRLWFPSYFTNDFEQNKPIYFIFFSNWLFLERLGYLDFLKANNKDSKFICFFQDLISLKKDLNINQIKEVFDLVISFDHKEAKEHDLRFFPLVNSKAKYDLSSSFNQSDVFFLGAAKNRFTEIISAYEILKEKNLKCNFFITGVNKKDQKYKDDIHYIDSMSYVDNLKQIQKTNSILEIMQKGGHGYTQRMVEAITYNKKIITNNPEVMMAPFYNPSNILYFSNVKDIVSENIFFNNFTREADHHYKNEISPIRLLEFIIKQLENK